MLLTSLITSTVEEGKVTKEEVSYSSNGAYSAHVRKTKVVSMTLAFASFALYRVQLLDAAISGNPIAPMPGQVGRYRYIGQTATVQLQPWVAMQQPLGMPNGNSVVGAQLRINF